MSAAGERDDGFTLFEMLVVLAILGLIAGLVYPALARGRRAQALNGAAATLSLLLREARGRALRLDRPVTVGAEAAALRIGNDAPAALPADIRVDVRPAAGISFFPDGSSSGGTVTLASGDRRIGFAVAAATGLATRATP